MITADQWSYISAKLPTSLPGDLSIMIDKPHTINKIELASCTCTVITGNVLVLDYRF